MTMHRKASRVFAIFSRSLGFEYENDNDRRYTENVYIKARVTQSRRPQSLDGRKGNKNVLPCSLRLGLSTTQIYQPRAVEQPGHSDKADAWQVSHSDFWFSRDQQYCQAWFRAKTCAGQSYTAHARAHSHTRTHTNTHKHTHTNTTIRARTRKRTQRWHIQGAYIHVVMYPCT